MDEDRKNQYVIVEVSKKDVTPEEEVLTEDSEGMDIVEPSSIKPLCISCGEKPQGRRQRCDFCFFAYQQQNPDWRYEGGDDY